MGDFYQTGVVATFHRLGRSDLDKLEGEISWYAQQRPIGLVLPALCTELQGEALRSIVEALKGASYLRQIVVTLGRANEKEFQEARRFFSVLPQETRIIHNDGPQVQGIYRLLEERHLGAGMDGKGRSAWMAYGYILATRQASVIALHDCDILTYNRELLARLCYPVINPNLDYSFCKGYYSRVTDRMHGRVTRLLVTPLIRALIKILGHLPLLVYLDSFRYPLAGEFAMQADLALVNRIPADWGLEVGVLAEVYRNISVRRVCQVDLCENYDHKHQALSPEDPDKGLLKMCVDIAKSLFRTLASDGVVFSDGFFKTLVTTYLRTAEDTIKRYEDDAAINGLVFYRHEEAKAVEAFVHGIRLAASTIREDPLGAPLIPNWNRVTSAIPDILDQVRDAVESDNA